MSKRIFKPNFFVVGGTLGRDANSYVRRPVDDELLHLTQQGEYCNVLAARQTGKSSLMVRTSERLKKEGVRSVIIDLTSIGSAVSPSEWYFGLLSRLKTELSLKVDEQAWWQARSEQSPIQRFSDFLRDVVLEEIPDEIVVFVDEIDSTLKLDFTDDFFAAIRAAYNARSRDRAFDRLTFVLLGVARPADLIKDRTRTPYNIGTSVDVTDFQQDELQGFEDVLEEALPRQGREVLRWALEWTGGQPYLTQKLCAEIVEQASGKITEGQVNSLVEELFLGDKARTETNLRSIRDRASGNPYAAKMLRIYRQVLQGKEVQSEERSIEQNELKLTGLVKVDPKGCLQIRNRIYARTFDLAWVKDNVPVTTGQRVTWIMSAITIIALSVAGWLYYQQQNQAAEVLAQTYIENFTTSQSSEIRISGLAGLYELGDEYATQANELFNGLTYEEQLALLDVAIPENVGNELYIVISNNYQDQPNTTDGNQMLSTMSTTLEQTAVSGATSLAIEINAWLDGREQLTQEEYTAAITFYSNAWNKSVDRKQENLAVVYERASAYIATEEYDLALDDLNEVIKRDESKTTQIQETVLGNKDFAVYWRENAENYPDLSAVLVLPTEPPPTITPSPAAPTPTPMPDGWLFYDDFEMAAQDYHQYDLNSDDVQIVELDAPYEHVLMVEPHSYGVIQFGDNWDNYAFEFDLMMTGLPSPPGDDGWLEILVRSSAYDNSSRSSYGFQIGALDFYGGLYPDLGSCGHGYLNCRFGNCQSEGLSWSYTFPVKNEEWQHIRIEIQDDIMTTYVNGYQKVRTEDARIAKGMPGFSFSCCSQLVFYFDNIFVETIE